MCDTRVLILPGRGNSGEEHWQSIWQNSNPSFERVVQEEWQNPHCEQWVKKLDEAINRSATPVVLVAHSLSVSLVNHWAKHHTGPVTGALLVAPSDVEAEGYAPGTQGFTPIPLNRLPFSSVVVVSSNDPKVSLERATCFAQAWGARLSVVGPKGHLGSDAGLGDWPMAKQLLSELIHRPVD